MKKRNIIICIIITLMLIAALNLLILVKNRKIYITRSDELDGIKISMMKLENGVITVVKQVPSTGSWEMEYNCDDEDLEVFWDESNRKLLMNNITETSCIIKFIEAKSSVNVISMYVDDMYVDELDEDIFYTLLSYSCSNGEVVVWNASNNNIVIKNVRKNTKCNLYFQEGIPEFHKTKLVNKPALVTGMTPVKWSDNYVESTTTENDPDWYDYSTQKWANAKTADGSYWVWIPRYAYKITTGIHNGGSGIYGSVSIKFLMGGTNKAADSTVIETSGYDYDTKNTSVNYFLHPAFTFGDEELTGIWVAKFKASVSATGDACYTAESEANCNKTTLIPAFKPTVKSWRYIYIGNTFDVALSLKSKSAFGWAGTDIDTHLMKNTERGAVAYLTQSIYGANEQIWINNNNTYTTGCTGASVNASSTAACSNAYNTSGGVKGSTTFNITGVYDMSGSCYEYTAAYVDNANGNLGTYGQSILNAAAKYKNVYAMGTTDSVSYNYAAAKNIYGDSVYETSLSTGSSATNSWFADHSVFPASGSPWFARGGTFAQASSGPFAFNSFTGAASSAYYGFRAVVAVIPYP